MVVAGQCVYVFMCVHVVVGGVREFWFHICLDIMVKLSRFIIMYLRTFNK